jgi:hypothetical protein
MDFYFFQPSLIQRELEEAGLAVDEIIERDPHPLEIKQKKRSFDQSSGTCKNYYSADQTLLKQ